MVCQPCYDIFHQPSLLADDNQRPLHPAGQESLDQPADILLRLDRAIIEEIALRLEPKNRRDVAQAIVEVTGGIGVAATQAIARVVAYLTGAGTIPPSEQPLPPPAAGTPSPVQALLLPANVVV